MGGCLAGHVQPAGVSSQPWISIREWNFAGGSSWRLRATRPHLAHSSQCSVGTRAGRVEQVEPPAQIRSVLGRLGLVLLELLPELVELPHEAVVS